MRGDSSRRVARAACLRRRPTDNGVSCQPSRIGNAKLHLAPQVERTGGRFAVGQLAYHIGAVARHQSHAYHALIAQAAHLGCIAGVAQVPLLLPAIRVSRWSLVLVPSVNFSS